MKLKQIIPTFTLITMMSLSTQVGAVIISVDNTNPDDIPGLTGFQTLGSMMDGMSVTANFSTGSQTLSWADTGLNSGGVSGNVSNLAWSLSVAGDTFATNAWSMILGDGLTLNSLTLDGRTGLTVFDRNMNVSTSGSAAGKDINVGTTALYSHVVGINGAAPVLDLYHLLNVNFATTDTGTGAVTLGVTTDFRFSQDTDNDSRFAVPEPGTLALFAIAVLGLGFSSRFKKV